MADKELGASFSVNKYYHGEKVQNELSYTHDLVGQPNIEWVKDENCGLNFGLLVIEGDDAEVTINTADFDMSMREFGEWIVSEAEKMGQK